MLNYLQEIFACLQKHNVKYVVIGGIAAALHGVPRATFDLHLLVEASPDNAQKLLDALLDAKLVTALFISAPKLLAKEITIFQDRVPVDVKTSTPGLKFHDARQNRITMTYKNQNFFVTSREDLITSKRAAGHKVDLEDIHLLELSQKDD